MSDKDLEARERTKEIQKEFAEKGDATGWFEALYSEAAGDNEKIPWAEYEPNKYLRRFADRTNLSGENRTALVVGCGLGYEARFLDELGFQVTAFDISKTAVQWARRLHADRDIRFFTADLFDAPKEWFGAFEFVLEIYTIQPLPLEIRPQVIDAIASFVKFDGKLLIVTRGRDDDEIPPELPWALSRRDLSRFAKNNLKEIHFEEMPTDDDPPTRRFIVEYLKK